MYSGLEEVRRRKKLADHYYDNYMKYFRLGDFGKASEFLWGAINNLVYCLGLLDGQKLSDHGKVIKYLDMLASLGQDDEIFDGIAAAQTLHANFYHDFMKKDVFDYHRPKADKLVQKLAIILTERLNKIEADGQAV